MTVYEAVGGDATFERIVALFYAGVERDPLLRPLYPDDLGPAKRHLTLFLIQFFGGHPTYSRLRGHPRLRARHLPFPITRAVRDAWVRNMTAAVGPSRAAGRGPGGPGPVFRCRCHLPHQPAGVSEWGPDPARLFGSSFRTLFTLVVTACLS